MQWLLELSPVVPRCERQDEFHCCSFSCLAVNADCSAVRFNHFFGQCEPKACSSHSVFSLQPSLIEPVKDVRLILWRDAGEARIRSKLRVIEIEARFHQCPPDVETVTAPSALLSRGHMKP